MSLKSAAPQLGVNYTYLSKIENGHVIPSAAFLERLADFYGKESDMLYDAAGRVPQDVERIILSNLPEVAALVRRRFRGDGTAR